MFVHHQHLLNSIVEVIIFFWCHIANESEVARVEWIWFAELELSRALMVRGRKAFMTDVSQNLVSDLVDEIGLLIQSRISAYIKKHACGSEAAFLSKFLVFPEFEDYRASLLKAPMKARHKFDEFVSNDLMGVSLVDVTIDDGFVLNFNLEIYPSFINEDLEWINAELKNGQLTPFANELEVLLQGLADDQLVQFTKKIRNNRIMSMLKDS